MVPSPPKKLRTISNAENIPENEEEQTTPSPENEERRHRVNPNRWRLENLLGLPGARQREDPEKYVTRLGNEQEMLTKFKFLKIKSKFLIKDVPADPEALLGGIFQFCTDEAMTESASRGIQPTHVGYMINSEHLENPIWVRIRPKTENTVDALLNFFLEVAQSYKQKGITLWGSPFNMEVTTCDRNALEAENRTILGGARRALAPVHHSVNKASLIKIQHNDNYCLFYALQASMMQRTSNWTEKQLQRYFRSLHGMAGRLQADVHQLMSDIGAPYGLEEYNACKWVPLVVDHWNGRMPNHFKVFIFGSNGHYKPLFKYGADNYKTPIVLYFDVKEEEETTNNGEQQRPRAHFYAVQQRTSVFTKPYCLSCESVYSTPAEHRVSCKARCLYCSKMGQLYGCKESPIFKKHCHKCSKIFRNEECWQHHLNTDFCKRSRQCKDCGVIWDVHKNGRNGHICNARHCKRCNKFHANQNDCFIQPLEPKKQSRPARFVAFDFETTQDEPLNTDGPNDGKKRHKVNFAAARVACQACIEDGSWKESMHVNRGPDMDCKICGANRVITFSQRDFTGTKVDMNIVDEDPLKAFVKWLLHDLPENADTYAYSHFGGRFDMVFVFKELHQRGFNPELIRKGNKLFEMKIKKEESPSIVFRDSYNLMPGSLASLVPHFGLDVVDKPFFPHLCNRESNYGKQIFPTPEDYMADAFMPGKRKEFDVYYEQHRHEPFLLEEALPAYCTVDVEILMAALIAFRQEFMDISKRPPDGADGKTTNNRAASKIPHDGLDPLRDCIQYACVKMDHSCSVLNQSGSV